MSNVASNRLNAHVVCSGQSKEMEQLRTKLDEESRCRRQTQERCNRLLIEIKGLNKVNADMQHENTFLVRQLEEVESSLHNCRGEKLQLQGKCVELADKLRKAVRKGKAIEQEKAEQAIALEQVHERLMQMQHNNSSEVRGNSTPTNALNFLGLALTSDICILSIR